MVPRRPQCPPSDRSVHAPPQRALFRDEEGRRSRPPLRPATERAHVPPPTRCSPDGRGVPRILDGQAMATFLDGRVRDELHRLVEDLEARGARATALPADLRDPAVGPSCGRPSSMTTVIDGVGQPRRPTAV